MHNLGPKASGKNDENMLIIRDAPGLAAAYAVNNMAIYNQDRWRFRRHAHGEGPVRRVLGRQYRGRAGIRAGQRPLHRVAALQRHDRHHRAVS